MPLPDAVREEESEKSESCDDNGDDGRQVFTSIGPVGFETISSDFNFKPIYSIGAWQEPDEDDNRFVSVAILLFTGQDTTSSYSINVVDGEYLEYTVTWPIPFGDPKLLHRKWVTGSTQPSRMMHYHPMVTCFNEFFKRIRGDRERITTTSRLPLPFPVETEVDQHLLKFPGTSARILYCILRAPAQKKRSSAMLEKDLVFE